MNGKESREQNLKNPEEFQEFMNRKESREQILKKIRKNFLGEILEGVLKKSKIIPEKASRAIPN